MLSTTALIILLPLVTSHDLAIGLNSYGKKIFEENRQASPAIWRQKENVTIQAADNEVISKVLVIDKRPEKDGDAKIIDGGENKKNVTIELKSPTIFRGYDFHIEVYSVPAPHVSQDDLMSSTSQSIIFKDSINTEHAKSTFDDRIRDPRNLVNENKPTKNNGDGYTVSTIASSNTAELNLPGMTGMDKDEMVHIRKIGDDLSTTTTDEMLTSTIVESTTNHKIDTTALDMSTTLSEEPATASPDKNGKDIPDFDDLLSTDKDESRFVRQAKHENELSTLSDVSTTEAGETTTVSVTTEIGDVSIYSDTRESRQARYSESTNTTDNMKPILQIIIENGSMKIVTPKPEEDENNVMEGSGNIDTSTHTNEDNDITITSTESANDQTEEQFRNTRGVGYTDTNNSRNENMPNFPVLVDQSLIEKSNIITDDYVYVPIVAIISKQNYPLFQDIIDTISKNHSLSKLDINAINGNTKDEEISANAPVISYT